MFSKIFFLLLTFFLSPLCLLAYIKDQKFKVVIAFGMVPALAGLLIQNIFFFWGGRSSEFYLNVLIGIQIVFIAITFLKYRFFFLKEINNREIFLLLALFIVLFLIAFGLPVMANDPLEYLMMAKIFFREKSFSLYPFLSEDSITGFYTPSRHPLGYVSLIIAGLLCSIDAFLVIKLIAAFYFAVFLLSIYQVTGSRAFLYVFSAPLFVYVFSIFHIDIYRISIFVLSVFCMVGFFSNPKKISHILLTGIMVGLSMNAHSLGAFSLVLLSFGLYFLPMASYFQLFVVGVIAVFSGGFQYIENFMHIGKFITDSNIIWGLPQVNEKIDLAIRRNISTGFQWIMFGLFQGFTKIHFFGINFYQAFYAVARNLKKCTSHLQLISIIGVLLFYLIAFLAGDLGVKNPRYFLTIVPLLIFIHHGLNFNKNKIIIIIQIFLAIYSFSYFKDWSYNLSGSILNKNVAGDFFEEIKKLPITGPILGFEQSLFCNYSNHKILRDLNPGLMNFYNAKNINESLQALKLLSVQYIYLSNFMPATFYNSKAMEITGDPSESEIVLSDQGFRLFKINKNIKRFENFKPVSYELHEFPPNFIKKLLWNNTSRLDVFCKNVSKGDIIFLNFSVSGNGTVNLIINDISYARSVINNHKNILLQVKVEKTPFIMRFVFLEKIKNYQINQLLVEKPSK